MAERPISINGDIVPWINGFDIRASCFYTRNPNHDSIYEDKKPELKIVNFKK